MNRVRTCLLVILTLALLPAPIRAQGNEVTVPLAVAALEGAYDVAADGETCELVWSTAGTPTVRIETDAAPARHELTGGELVTLPEVDAARACLFVLEVTLPEARQYTVTLEGAELVQLAAADLPALEGAIVLPVALDAEGRYELVTDDYLDLPLDGVAGGLREMAPERPQRTVPPERYRVVGRVLLWTSGPEEVPFGCAAGPTVTGVYPGAQVIVRDAHDVIIGYGTLSYVAGAGAPVCAFAFTADVPEAEFYVFELGNGDRQVRSWAELELWSWRLSIETGAP